MSMINIVEFIAAAEVQIEKSGDTLVLGTEYTTRGTGSEVFIDASRPEDDWVYDLLNRYASLLITPMMVLDSTHHHPVTLLRCELMLETIRMYTLPLDVQETIQKAQCQFEVIKYIEHFHKDVTVDWTAKEVWSQMPDTMDFSDGISWEYAALFEGA